MSRSLVAMSEWRRGSAVSMRCGGMYTRGGCGLATSFVSRPATLVAKSPAALVRSSAVAIDDPARTCGVRACGSLVWFVPPALYPERLLAPHSTAAGPVRAAQLQAAASLQAARTQAIANTRAAFIAGLAGLAALGSLWTNARGVEISRRTLEQTQAAQAEAFRLQTRTLELQNEGQVTDRYTRAIEQLGESDSVKLTVRLGGIYALERIAVDSQRRDQATGVEVLSSFVRESTREVQRKSNFFDSYSWQQT